MAEEFRISNFEFRIFRFDFQSVCAGSPGLGVRKSEIGTRNDVFTSGPLARGKWWPEIQISKFKIQIFRGGGEL
jgi:hypothetical protein